MKNNLKHYWLKLNLFIITLIFTCNSTLGQWVRKADAVSSRSDLSESIIYQSKLYTFLGFYDYDRHTDSTSEVYDPATDTYTLLAPMPGNEAMTHEKIVLIDSTVWLIGGRVGQNPGPLTSAIWIYNIATNTWYKGPQLKDPATGDPLLWGAGGAAILGRTLHIFGGFIIDACNNDQSLYHVTLDVDTWLSDTTKAADWKNTLLPLPLKRNHFSTVVLGGKIYAIGGQYGHDCDGGLEKPFSHCYDPATDTWSELPLLPNARSHAEGSTFAIDGKIYVAGGQDENGESTNKVAIFDPAGNNNKGVWMEDSSLTIPAKIEGGTAKIINSTFIYSHGGEGTSANPKNLTYTRIIRRNPVYQFGFSKDCLKLTVDSGNWAKGKTLLFTIDSSKSYRIYSNAKWLKVTKNATGIATSNAVDIELTVNTAGLAPGDYKGVVTAIGTLGKPAFSEATYCVNLIIKGSNPSLQKFEAEVTGLNGVNIAKNHPGFSGTGFVDYQHLSGDYIEWTIDAFAKGSVLLNFRYSNGKETDRPLRLLVNGVSTDTISFSSTDKWVNWASVTNVVNLKAGINTIRLTAIGYSGPNIDYLSLNSDAIAPVGAVLSKIVKIPPGDLDAYLFPNPTSGNATLVLNNSSKLPANVEIRDMTGRSYKKIRLFKSSSNSLNFSVKDIPSGIYIMRISQGVKVASIKFIVDHKNGNMQRVLR